MVFTAFYDDIYLAFDDEAVAPIVVISCFLMDIAFIKPKNFKYACHSYMRGDNLDY